MTTLLAHFGTRTFIAVSSSGGDPNVAAGVASFMLAVAAFWGGIFVALVVLGCLLGDIWARRGAEEWSPSAAWSLAGFAHLGGAVFSLQVVVSVLSLTDYLNRRYDRL
ncbi:hypothetical protein [Haloarcula regularis]|uniref:hypothetical protein n=1 Tax=Haloarcula regularis TaxID=3033392 RepID=UPI0023E781DA|nr:hypothetical protein [Halomicroarcula sp. SYNS111]